MSPDLIEVAVSPNYLWNSAVCTPEGRLFASLPAWIGEPTPGVIEILPDGRLNPFPGNAWNEWAAHKDPVTAFVDVNSVIFDGKGSLWVLDAAAPALGSAIPGAVKVVELDIATGDTRRVIVFDEQTAHPGTRLAHMRFHGDHAFMVESKEASIFVIDLRDNSYRRILVGHPLLRCDLEDIPTVEGRKMELHGKPMYFHSDLIEIGADPDMVYFMCLFGRRIFQTHVDSFKDESLTDDQIAERISVAFELDRSFVSAITRDARGNLYIGDAEKGGISRLNPDGTVTSILRDPKIAWPIGPSVGPDGYLYFADSQVNRTPAFTGGHDRVVRPWRSYKLDISF